MIFGIHKALHPAVNKMDVNSLKIMAEEYSVHKYIHAGKW